MIVPYTEQVLNLRESKDYLAYGIARREQVLSFIGATQHTFVLVRLNIKRNEGQPCAKYPEVKRLALQFKTQWGDKQLEQDANTVYEITNKDR